MSAHGAVDAVERDGLDTPLVPLMLFQGAGLIEVPIKRYPGKSGALISKICHFLVCF